MRTKGQVFIKSLSFFFPLRIVWSLEDINRCGKHPIIFTKRQFPLTWLYLRICSSGPVASISYPFYDLSRFIFLFWVKFDLKCPQRKTLIISAVRLCCYISIKKKQARTFKVFDSVQDWSRFFLFCFLILYSVLVVWPLCSSQWKCHLYCWSAAVWSSVEALLFCHCSPSAMCKQLPLTAS